MPHPNARLPNVPVHDGSIFTWKGRLGFIEASDLGRDFCKRLRNDEPYIGFVVRSPKTGVEKEFVWNPEADEWVDGELVNRRFSTTDGRFMIEVYND